MLEATILIAEDDEKMWPLLELHMKKWGFRHLVAKNGQDALGLLKKNPVDIILSDQQMPVMDGMELLEKTLEKYDHIPFVMITAHASIEKAVAAIKQGAYDYIRKPINWDELHATLKRSLLYSQLNKKNKKLKDYLHSMYSFQNIVTKSSPMLNALKLAERVSRIPSTSVAIFGESGTGKEVLARAIHFAGDRMENSFVAVNCAGVPSGLLDSELFGHIKGAFTGADRNREGRFEMARQVSHSTLKD